MMGTLHNGERAEEVASLLKQADKLVKEGNLRSALELIVKAQSCDPRNLYAMAYEERVRALLAEEVDEGTNIAAQPPASLVKDSNLANVDSATSLHVPAKTAQQKQTPSLQYLSNLAVIQAQHSTLPVTGTAHLPAAEKATAEEEQDQKGGERLEAAEKAKEEERKRAAEEKIKAFLARGSSFFEKNEYNRALDEIARAYILDPANKKIGVLEEKVREAMELQRRTPSAAVEGKTEQLTKKEEEEKTKNAARQAAVEQQISRFLTQAASYMEKKEYRHALDEIARAYMLSPTHEKIRAIEETVRSAVEREQQTNLTTHGNEELGRTKKEEEEKRLVEERRRAALEQKIAAFLSRAAAFCERKEYNRALDEIARAYLFDPANEKIYEAEEKIRRAQEDARRADEEERNKAAGERRDLHTMIEMQARDNAKDTAPASLRPEFPNERERGQRKPNADIGRYVQRIRELFAANRFEEALSELAFVIILDPLNQEVLKLEQQIIEKQEERQYQQLELYRKQLEERQKRRQAIVAAIQMLAKERKGSDALRTITTSLVLDPLYEDVQEYEKRMLATQAAFLASCDEN
ncbi:MAG: hypothetical protein KGJ59_02750 [Bacteroidota bacterium]|nr:hypothetical protein [Bacteroidota bacterium]